MRLAKRLLPFRVWLAISAHAAGRTLALQYALRISQSVFASLQAVAVAALVEATVSHRSPTLGIALVTASLLATIVVQAVSTPLSVSINEKLQGHVGREVLALVGRLPTIRYRNVPAVADRVACVTNEAWRLSQSGEIIVSSVATVVNLVLVTALLMSIAPPLGLLPLLGLSRSWAAHRAGRMTWDAIARSQPATGAALRMLAIAHDPAHGFEARAYGAAGMLGDAIRGELRTVSRTQRRGSWRATVLDGSVRFAFALLYAGIVVAIALAATDGRFSVGDVVLLLLLASRTERAADGIADSARQAGQVLEFFRSYVWLQDYVRARAESHLPPLRRDRLRHGIELRGVTFSYVDGGQAALRDVNLLLPAGKTIAVVGGNGTGKSTLAMLLLRLYDPQHGHVLLDGEDLAGFDRTSWWASTSATFQDFCRYELRVRETVGVGDLTATHDEARLWRATERAVATETVRGAGGLDAQLGTRFPGGVELSGGQWQRLALARAFMRDKPLLLVLDEPSASIDPLVEDALLDAFRDAATDVNARGGITVIISHRMSTVRDADLIVVMDGGRVVEVGSHDELVAARGRYRTLYELQGRPYAMRQSPELGA
jgi:ATP-binding cassette subfamily B protein